MGELDGRIALVTGGGSGIGAVSARALAGAGARVVLADRRLAAAESIAAAVGGIAVELDIAQEAMVASVVDALEAAHGPLDILINCAGVFQATLPPEQFPMAQWDRMIAVHLRGTYLVTAAVGTRMARRGRGAIVTIASIAGMRSGPLHAYGPAKAGLISLTETLAGEWGRAGVRVNAVSPGFVRTPALERGLAEGALDPALLEQWSALGRMVRPDEIAAAVLFLASDRASAITGINLPVDAGYLVASAWGPYGGLRPAPTA